MSTPRALPPLYRDLRRLTLLTEQLVRGFARYHKYTLGTELRQQSMRAWRLAHRAHFDPAGQARWVENLVWAVDDFKLSLQMAQELGAFRDFRQFEPVALLAVQIGKQCGGWHRQTRSRGPAASEDAPPPLGGAGQQQGNPAA